MTDPTLIIHHGAAKVAGTLVEQFHGMLCDLTTALDEEVLFEEALWDPACAWQRDIDTAWRALAAQAEELRDRQAAGAGDLPLRRMAGLVLRALQAETLPELMAAFMRSARCVDALGPHCPSVHRGLVLEAHDGIDRMIHQAARHPTSPALPLAA